MTTRQRRRRFNTDEEDEQNMKNSNKLSVKFVEQVDYKMELEEEETKVRETVILNEDPTEEEKREAFKKKLRKYSDKMEGSGMIQLP